MAIKILSWIKNLFAGKQRENGYPRDYEISTLSNIAIGMGMKDDSNKVILRYIINKFGNYELKKYRYSEERVSVLSNIHKIPFFDKTRKGVRFPVYSRITPGESTFTIYR